jgi:hypothetical protein
MFSEIFEKNRFFLKFYFMKKFYRKERKVLRKDRKEVLRDFAHFAKHFAPFAVKNCRRIRRRSNPTHNSHPFDV